MQFIMPRNFKIQAMMRFRLSITNFQLILLPYHIQRPIQQVLIHTTQIFTDNAYGDHLDTANE